MVCLLSPHNDTTFQMIGAFFLHYLHRKFTPIFHADGCPCQYYYTSLLLLLLLLVVVVVAAAMAVAAPVVATAVVVVVMCFLSLTFGSIH